MKAIIQRVMKASVTVGEDTVGSIGRGLCVLVGISRYDTPKEMDYIIRKILNLKLFEDDQGRQWKKSVVDKDFEVLCVSQFTLEVILKGNSLDFHNAMGPDRSKDFYSEFIETVKSRYKPEKIQNGAFGEYMQVHIQNDGPVTIPIESVPPKPSDEEKSKEKKDKKAKAVTESKPEAGES